MGFISNNLLKSIEWTEDSKDTIVYKYPMDGRSIMFGSKLTVREGQVAVFVNKGKLADVFEPGMHTLHTSNLPILTQLLALPFGFKSPFYADIYFISKKQFTNQTWGTSTPITMRDAEFGTIRIKGYGKYSFRVDDSKTFLKEIFGTCESFATEDINNYLRSIVVASISDTIAESKVKALDLASNLLEFSKLSLDVAKSHFAEIGLKLSKLIIENFSFPEEVEKAIDAHSSMSVLSDMDSYIKYQSAKAIKDAANNPSGVSAMGNIATGLVMADAIKNGVARGSETKAEAALFCPNCGAKNKKSGKFCTECGHSLKESLRCKKCGTELASSSKFCPECGTKVK